VFLSNYVLQDYSRIQIRLVATKKVSTGAEISACWMPPCKHHQSIEGVKKKDLKHYCL